MKTDKLMTAEELIKNNKKILGEIPDNQVTDAQIPDIEIRFVEGKYGKTVSIGKEKNKSLEEAIEKGYADPINDGFVDNFLSVARVILGAVFICGLFSAILSVIGGVIWIMCCATNKV